MSKSKKSATDLLSDTQLLAEHRAQTQIKALKEQVDGLTRQTAALQEALGITVDLAAAPRPKPIARREIKSGLREATALVMCSDWHVEEHVDPRMVNGKNEYTPEIARGRVAYMAKSLDWAIASNRKTFQIRDLVLWLGGDMITGYIHEELLEGNFMSPTEAILFAQELVEGLISYALAIPGIERVIVPCSYGNHGRTTHKPRIATGAHNSYEWLMYQQLKLRYASNPRVEIHVANGEHLYLNVYGYNVRFNHGDPIRSMGGIGGVIVPAKRIVARWQTMEHAHLTCLGHHHQLFRVRDIALNGSLIGWSPYAMRIGAEYEPPQQGFKLIDSKRGLCVEAPLYVEDAK